MTTPSYRSEAHGGDTSGTSVTVAMPAGVVVGDVLIAIACFQGTTLPSSDGWTSLSSIAGPSSAVSSRVFIRTVNGTEGSSFTFTNPDGGVETACIVAFADATEIGVVFDKLEGAGGSASMTSPSVTAPKPGSMLVFLGAHGFDLASATPPAGFTERVDFGLTSSFINRSVYVATAVQSAAGATGTKTATLSASGTYGPHGWMVVLAASNYPPNAPTLITPVGGTSINKDTANVFRFASSDPDTGDSMSAFQPYYRVVGDPSWTTPGLIVSPSAQITFAAGTFTEDDYEWQVETYDSRGELGPRSSSGFFTAATVPTDLEITAPLNGSTIPLSSATVEWSTPEQQSFQVRRTSDAAGTTVYFDSGEIVSTTTRSYELTFPVNNRDEYIQVRKKSDGLWSDWVFVTVSIAYTPPATPLVTILEDVPTGAVSVEAEHPTPSGLQPAVAYMNVWRRDTGDTDGIRVATGLAPAATFTDWFVASGHDYEYQVEAVGTNSTSAFSDWTGGAVIPGEDSAFPSTLLFPSTDLFPATA